MIHRVDFRQGRWQDAMSNVNQVDHLILDAPYSARTHGVQPTGAAGDNRTWVGEAYQAWGQPEIAEVCEWAKLHVKQWVVSMTDHVLFPIWEAELTKRGYYVFAPVIAIEKARNVRLRGDGPSCWATMIVVARPRSKAASQWRALVGAYVVERTRDKMIGGKPLELMNALVKDYSDPDDIIADLCAGFGTTLIAAASAGRRAVGAEVDPEQYLKTQARIKERLVMPLFDGLAPRPLDLF